MRQAYAAPLHDIRPERAHVLDRMARLEAEAHDLGDVATGPLEYAVGRGYLSLHDHANARSHLEAALRAGYAPPEVRYALAVAQGRVRAAAGDGAGALRDLEATASQARASGLKAYELEARLALGEVEMRLRRVAAGRARLREVESEAKSRGLHLLARQAASAAL